MNLEFFKTKLVIVSVWCGRGCEKKPISNHFVTFFIEMKSISTHELGYERLSTLRDEVNDGTNLRRLTIVKLKKHTSDFQFSLKPPIF